MNRTKENRTAHCVSLIATESENIFSKSQVYDKLCSAAICIFPASNGAYRIVKQRICGSVMFVLILGKYTPRKDTAFDRRTEKKNCATP